MKHPLRPWLTAGDQSRLWQARELKSCHLVVLEGLGVKVGRVVVVRHTAKTVQKL